MYKVNVIPLPFSIIMIPNLQNSIKLKGSSISSPAHGWCGARATINKLAPQKNFKAKPKQAGKRPQ